MRTLDQVTDEINNLLESDLPFGSNKFYKVCIQHEKNDKLMIITRNGGQEIGELVTPSPSKNIVFYHRIISEESDDLKGKGNQINLMHTTIMRLVGIGRRGTVSAKTHWDNDEICGEVTKLINQNSRLSNKERVIVVGQNSNWNEVIEQELANTEWLKRYKFEMYAFYVEYKIKRRQSCVI